MNNWRPEGWVNPCVKQDPFDLSKWVDTFAATMYEAGADAILKALKDQGVHLKAVSSVFVTKPGHLVFIPDDSTGDAVK